MSVFGIFLPVPAARTRRCFDQGATLRPGYDSGLFVARWAEYVRVLITIESSERLTNQGMSSSSARAAFRS
jgi:hypothetical protein